MRERFFFCYFGNKSAKENLTEEIDSVLRRAKHPKNAKIRQNFVVVVALCALSTFFWDGICTVGVWCDELNEAGRLYL